MDTFTYDMDENMLIIQRGFCTWYWEIDFEDDVERAKRLINTIDDVGSGKLDSNCAYVGYGEFAIANTMHDGVLHTSLKVNPAGYDIWIDIDWKELKRLREVLQDFIYKQKNG